ncbi:MAG: VCBS repeat-containing protein [Oscillatoriales cyanobacterium C42_A2020_001]|nr:VCBS repeat-containing protein [Leptolyngbyaceae cyanobacterium C42_A2020_001]
MADNINIFDNTAVGTQRLIQATAGVLTLQSTAADPGFSIGPGDTDDFFRLTVSRSSNVVVKLNPDVGDLSLAVLDAAGNLIPTIGTSNNPSALADAAVTNAANPLQPGQTYYIRVSGSEATTVNYTLTVETNPVSRADILWRNISPPGSPDSGANGIWRMNGTQVLSYDNTGVPVDPAWRLAAVGDFNRDGAADYFWQEPTTGTIGTWLMDASGTTVKSFAQIPYNVTGEWYIGGVGDFNGDAGLDIIWRNSNTGLTGVWLMNGTNVASFQPIDYITDTSWLIESVADFNGDSKPDVFYRNSATGENLLWMMDGISFLSAEGNLPSLPIGWSMEGVGDFDGDGDADLLWRDYSTGTNAVWFLNRTEFASGEFLQPLVDPTIYRIAGVITNTLPIDLAGNTPQSNFYIGKLDNTATYADTIGGTDSFDYYVFNLAVGSKIGITAQGTDLSALADIEVLAADGSTVLGSTTATNPNEERLTDLTLNAGSYYVRVRSFSPTSVGYAIAIAAEEQLPVNLRISADPPITTPVTTFRRLDGTTFTSSNAVSVKDPFTFDMDYKVTYAGRPLNEFKVGFFLSKDGVLDAADLRLDLNNDGQSNANDFALITGAQPNTEITRTQRLTLPSKDSPFWIDEGLYNIIIVLDPDNEILEQDPQTGNPAETDNAFAAPIRVRDARRPDLIPENFDVVQPGIVRGNTINLAGAIRNIGTASSDALNTQGTQFTIRFYLSTDQQLSTATDFALTNNISFTPLAAGAQTSIGNNVTATIPTTWGGYNSPPPGNQYYVLMVVNSNGNVQEITDGNLNNVVFDTLVIS